jgi:hypothetical protein
MIVVEGWSSHGSALNADFERLDMHRKLVTLVAISAVLLQPGAYAAVSPNVEQVTQAMASACVPVVDVHAENDITNPTIELTNSRSISDPKIVVVTTNVGAAEKFVAAQGWPEMVFQRVPNLTEAKLLTKIKAPPTATGLLYQAKGKRLVVKHKTYVANSKTNPIYQTVSIVLSQWDGHGWSRLGKTVTRAFAKGRCPTVWWDSYSVVGPSDDQPIFSDGTNGDGPWYPLSLPDLPHGYYRIVIEGYQSAAVTIRR